MRNVYDNGAEELKTHAYYVQYFFPPEYRAIYEIIWKNMVEPNRPPMKI
jgi:hypothetical protein